MFILSRHKIIFLSLIFLFIPSLSSSVDLSEEKPDTILLELDDLMPLGTSLNGHISSVNCVSFSPDGRVLASAANDNKIILWDVKGKKMIRTLTGHTGPVQSVSFNGNGSMIVSGSSDGTVVVWDVRTGTLLKVLKGHPWDVRAAAFSPDDRFIASGGGNNGLLIWDTVTGKTLKTLRHPSLSDSINTLAFSPDGGVLVTGGSNHVVVLWNTATWEMINTHKFGGYVKSVVFSPDGDVVAIGGDGNKIVLLDGMTGNVLRTTENIPAVEDVAFSPDGKFIAAAKSSRVGANRTVVLLDFERGSIIRDFWGIPKLRSFTTPDAEAIAFSPDGKLLAAGGANGIVRIIEDPLGKDISHEFRKSDFETTDGYHERVSHLYYPYRLDIVLDDYDADKEHYISTVEHQKIFIQIPRNRAKELGAQKDGFVLRGSIHYYDDKKVKLINGLAENLFTGSTFSVVNPRVVKDRLARRKAPPVKEKPPSFIIEEGPVAGPVREHDIAVIIGIESYRSLPLSSYSKRDANAVKKQLISLGFAERNIEFLEEERATKSAFEKTFEAWLPNRVNSESQVFVYYSGHGSPDPKTGEAYLVPSDADPNYLSVTGYPLKRLYEKLGSLKAREVIVVLDACFSGAGGRSVLAKGTRPVVLVFEGYSPAPNLAVLAATEGSQISTSSDENRHGIFTYYFLQALKQGKKSILDIYDYVRPRVEDDAKKLNVEQTPTLRPNPDTLRDNFFLAK